MIRTLWFIANLVPYTLYYATKAVAAGMLKMKNRPFGVYDQCGIRWSVRMLKVAGVKVQIVGDENIPRDHPVVFVSNHNSWFDIFTLFGHMPIQVRFVAKKELQKVPMFGRSITAAGHIYIDRSNRQAAFAAYEESAKGIAAGTSAVVFAEGTRSRDGELQPFKKGPFVLAIAAQVPVVPMYIAGTFPILRKGSLRITPHPVALMIGDEIPTRGMTYDDRERLMQETHAAVAQLRVDSERVLG